MLVSVVIRTFNEEKYLERLLDGIVNQERGSMDIEIVIVDSGSTDRTLEIAEKYNCVIATIAKHDFTFGRSLNLGCSVAKGDYLVFVSGHCFPVNTSWLINLINPLANGIADYTYGKQEGAETTKFSEFQHFRKFFPDSSKVPQNGYFCNNANAAITRAAWKRYRFEESLTGLEDMFLAKLLVGDGGKIAYVADASVFHIHDESWNQVRTRYEREAYALQKIMPEVHFTKGDFCRFLISSLLNDFAAAIKERVFLSKFKEIVLFRFMLYWGTYRGNHEVRKLSNEMKYKYFYPKGRKGN
jgi:glycosyltransferase involved in cell wall biosynthesis